MDGLEIILAMMLWISNVTGYTIPNPPDIVYVDSSGIKSEAYGCDMEKVPEEFVDICNARDLWFVDDIEKKNVPLGLYNHEEKTIFVNLDFMKSEAHDRSVIFHELTHHMQYHNGVYDKVQCFGELEKEAYDLQDKWLQEKYNVGIHETIGINDLFLMLITNCRDNAYHTSPDPEYQNQHLTK